MKNQKTMHWSDCAVNNGPALKPGPCDCGGFSEPETGKDLSPVADLTKKVCSDD